MAQHNTTDQGLLTISTFGAFTGLVFGEAAVAINPRLTHARSEGPRLLIAYGVGGWSETMQFSFNSPAAANAALRDFLRCCANALRAGDPAGGAVT